MAAVSKIQPCPWRAVPSPTETHSSSLNAGSLSPSSTTTSASAAASAAAGAGAGAGVGTNVGVGMIGGYRIPSSGQPVEIGSVWLWQSVGSKDLSRQSLIWDRYQILVSCGKTQGVRGARQPIPQYRGRCDVGAGSVNA